LTIWLLGRWHLRAASRSDLVAVSLIDRAAGDRSGVRDETLKRCLVIAYANMRFAG